MAVLVVVVVAAAAAVIHNIFKISSNKIVLLAYNLPLPICDINDTIFIGLKVPAIGK
jgi:hypothetical protein